MAVRTVRLEQLKIDRLRSDLEVETVPLSASVYLKALQQDDELLYTEYTKRLDDEFGGQPGMPWVDFKELVASIRDNGFNPQAGDSILLHGRLVFDGQHRLSALFHLYGPLCELTVVDDEVTSVTPR